MSVASSFGSSHTTDSGITSDSMYYSLSDGDGLKGYGIFEDDTDTDEKDADKEKDRDKEDSESHIAGTTGGSSVSTAGGSGGSGNSGNGVAKKTRMRVLGHACAAGCGHWCWAANERFELAA